MDPVLRAAAYWYELVMRSYTDYWIGAAVLSIAAVGILILLQHEYRRGRLLSNFLHVLGGYVIAISLLPLAMSAFAQGWAMLDASAPFISRIAAYLFGIYERHPLLVLVLVGIGATAYFLKQSWPYRISWGPVRALGTVLGIVLLMHVTGPIADFIDEGPAPALKPVAAPSAPPREAVARAIKAGDLRYLSVPACSEEVLGVVPAPASGGVRKLGPSCDEALGSQGAAVVRAWRTYAAEYNRLMQEHNRAAEPKPAEVSKVVENRTEGR